MRLNCFTHNFFQRRASNFNRKNAAWQMFNNQKFFNKVSSKSARQYNGFTLIELTLYISIISIILFAASQLLMVTIQTTAKNKTIVEVEMQLQQITHRLIKDLQDATIISTVQPGQTTNSIVFSKPTNSQPITYAHSNQQITHQVGSAPSIPIHNNRIIIESLEFTFLNTAPQSIRFTITARHSNLANRPEFNHSQTYYGTITLPQ